MKLVDYSGIIRDAGGPREPMHRVGTMLNDGGSGLTQEGLPHWDEPGWYLPVNWLVLIEQIEPYVVGLDLFYLKIMVPIG